MKITPTQNNVLVKKITYEDINDFELMVFTNTTDNMAEVVATGPNVRFGIEVGDRVVLQKYSGTKIDNDGETYYIVPDLAVFAKIC